MSEKNEPTADVPAASPEVPPSPPSSGPVDPVAAAPAPAAPARPTLRERLSGARPGDRVYGVRGLLAATVAALIVGGVGGAAIHAAVGGGPEHGRFSGDWHRDGPGGPDRGGFDRRGLGDDDQRGPGYFGQGPGVPGQLPPTTAPEDDSDS